MCLLCPVRTQCVFGNHWVHSIIIVIAFLFSFSSISIVKCCFVVILGQCASVIAAVSGIGCKTIVNEHNSGKNIIFFIVFITKHAAQYILPSVKLSLFPAWEHVTYSAQRDFEWSSANKCSPSAPSADMWNMLACISVAYIHHATWLPARCLQTTIVSLKHDQPYHCQVLIKLSRGHGVIQWCFHAIFIVRAP